MLHFSRPSCYTSCSGEQRRAQGTQQITDEDLALNDNWIRPRAVRAASGHSMSFDPDIGLMRVDPNRFAIHPSMPLVEALRGSFHSTACHNLQWHFAWNGSCRQFFGEITQPHFGIFAPWDRRNMATKYRVQGVGPRLWRFSKKYGSAYLIPTICMSQRSSTKS